MRNGPLTFASLLAVTLVTGCVGIVPLKVPKSAAKGREVNKSMSAFIRVGGTTRSEVIDQLGNGYVSLPHESAIAYTWEGGVHYVGWWFLASTHAAAGKTYDWGGWRGYFIAFDENQVVRAQAFKSLSINRSVHEQLDHWQQTVQK
jgi:hypothetical protein